MKTISFIFGASILVAAPAFAHDGARVWVDVVGNKVVTLTSNNDLTPAIYTTNRIFKTELLNLFDVYTTEFPGYEVRRSGGHVAPDTTFGFGIPSPLMFYNAATDGYLTAKKKFGSAQTVQMAVSLGAELRFTSDLPVSGFDFFEYTQPGDHSHMAYTMAGNGEALDGPTGVYVLPMSLTSAGVTASDAYYILIGKGVSQESPQFELATLAARSLTAIPADTNFDGRVDAMDLGALASHWQRSTNWSGGDFNFDGIADIFDLHILASHWDGAATFAASLSGANLPLPSVPEPSGMSILGLLMMKILGQRRNESGDEPLSKQLH